MMLPTTEIQLRSRSVEELQEPSVMWATVGKEISTHREFTECFRRNGDAFRYPRS